MRKTVLLAQHTALAVLAVGLRQKALLQRFLLTNATASRVFRSRFRSFLVSY